ncbi:MAG: hypothetical protein ABR588_09635 [Sphingomicrobium sp.]|nr:hypothetical protein [Sphingomonadales bacterium]
MDLSSPPRATPRQRHDGWTAERRMRFLMVLELTGSIRAAAAAAGMNRAGAYRLRDRPGTFGRDWDAALARRRQRALDAQLAKATLLQRQFDETDNGDRPRRPPSARKGDKGDSSPQNPLQGQADQPCRPARRDPAALWALIDAACR